MKGKIVILIYYISFPIEGIKKPFYWRSIEIPFMNEISFLQ